MRVRNRGKVGRGKVDFLRERYKREGIKIYTQTQLFVNVAVCI